MSSEGNRQRFDYQCTTDHWTVEGAWQIGRGLFWLELPAVQKRLNKKVSGDSDMDWVHYTLAQRFAGRLPMDRCLSLGCGEGGLERRLASLGAFRACDAFDLAPDLIARAQALAQQSGYAHIQYAVEDANSMALPRQIYDAVWSAGATHHFQCLEHVFEEVAGALRPGGLFILKEYVGPNRFQFPAGQRHIMKACHNLLPEDYRRLTPAAASRFSTLESRRDWQWWAGRALDKLREGDLHKALWRRLERQWSLRRGHRPVKPFTLPTAASVRSVDPSEAVRAADILPLLRHYFEIAEIKPLGGSILQFLLAGIAGNFQDQEGARLLEMLFSIEDALMDTGELQSDFAYIVARPRSSED